MQPLGSEWDSDSVGERATARAPVTPRVYAPSTGEPLPLDVCIRRLIDCQVKGLICLHGPPGAGKTTALAHLKASLPPEICPTLLDRPLRDDEYVDAGHLVICTDHSHRGPVAGIGLQMASWSVDDCIEYLLASHPDRCKSVMARVQALTNGSLLGGRPELWRIVLDAFARDESIHDIAVALRTALEPVLTIQGAPIGMCCLQWLAEGKDLKDFPDFVLPTLAGRLIRHRPVQTLLAADYIVEQLCNGKGQSELEAKLPDDLIVETGRLAAYWPSAIEQIDLLAGVTHLTTQPMAASLRVAIDPAWRPDHLLANLASARLAGVDWRRIDLAAATLAKAQFGCADLRYADLRSSRARAADFGGANLRYARFERAHAEHANFAAADLANAQARRLIATEARLDNANLQAASLVRAVLQGGSLRGARLIGADLSRADLTECAIDGADFSDALLCRAKLDRCRLTVATFDRASFRGASLRHCDLAEMRLSDADFRKADLKGADLSDAVMPRGDFEGATLCNCGLANIDWEGANLRGADLRGSSFHLGSTRCGLVGSTIAGEGSRTGFYTDEYNEQDYKPPEEIRKANLRGADVRGAKLRGVDFYLVDLRDVVCTPKQRRRFQAMRAIL